MSYEIEQTCKFQKFWVNKLENFKRFMKVQIFMKNFHFQPMILFNKELLDIMKLGSRVSYELQKIFLIIYWIVFKYFLPFKPLRSTPWMGTKLFKRDLKMFSMPFHSSVDRWSRDSTPAEADSVFQFWIPHFNQVQ